MDAVASYKVATSLSTDKRVNLIYGLNGTGKSTLSDFLYEPSNPRFHKCRKVSGGTCFIFVYNQKFIQDTFYVADSFKGVFSLSKENKLAELKITQAQKEISDLTGELQRCQSDKEEILDTLETQRQRAIDKTWKIKTSFAGGDRVLEYCLEGLKGQKEKLFLYLGSVARPNTEPTKTASDLRKEVEALKDDAATVQPELPRLVFSAHDVEANPVFGKAIVGNKDSEVAALIEALDSSDWVKLGLAYLPKHIAEGAQRCPFCQESTITQRLVDSLRDYFDETYDADMATLEDLDREYRDSRNQLPSLSTYTDHPLAADFAASLTQKYLACTKGLDANEKSIKEKIARPKFAKQLIKTESTLAAFNAEVDSANNLVREYNSKLANRTAILASLKDEFWKLMRWQFDQTISRFNSDEASAKSQLSSLDARIDAINGEINRQKRLIADAQRETVNVDEAVRAINSRLLDLGIDDFAIGKDSETHYRVVRSGESNDVFRTLSEGEKMVISFLYFCELCRGRASADDVADHARIVVIDDPISSLSHVFIFNVGQLIRSMFFRDSRVSQIFVLTHSLYFFYELTERNHDKRRESQKLFRMSKSPSGSAINEMRYEEIQNDYQAYWSIVNDSTQPPALIANCMRNIVEYFFNFVRRKDLNEVFQMPELRDVKFQAFCRYVNRESHSLGQNILDLKEFDYEVFKQGLRLVFEATGYSEHFQEMSKG